MILLARQCGFVFDAEFMIRCKNSSEIFQFAIRHSASGKSLMKYVKTVQPVSVYVMQLCGVDKKTLSSCSVTIQEAMAKMCVNL